MSELNNQLQPSAAEQAQDRILESLDESIAKQLENYADAIVSINDLSILTQKATTQQFLLSTALRLRLKLQPAIDNAIALNNPTVLALAEAQAEQIDDQIIEVLEQNGVPKKVAKAAITQTITSMKDYDQIETVTRHDNGRIKSMDKLTNGVS